MKKKTQLFVGASVIAIGITAIIAMNMPQDSQSIMNPEAYVIDIDPDEQVSIRAIEASQGLTEIELRSEIVKLAPRILKTEQLAAFIHALQLYMQDNDLKEYKKWEKTWFESSTTLFVFSNLTGTELRSALSLDSSRTELESAYVSVVTMLPLLEEASSKVSRGVLMDVFGYPQEDLLLESWPFEE